MIAVGFKVRMYLMFVQSVQRLSLSFCCFINHANHPSSESVPSLKHYLVTDISIVL